MNRNNSERFNPREYEKQLSPFGRKVLGTLIKQWSADCFPNRERNRNSSLPQCPPPRYNNSNGRVLTFGRPSTTVNTPLRNPTTRPREFYNDEIPFDFPETENNLHLAPPTATTMLISPPPEFHEPPQELFAAPPVPAIQKYPAPLPTSTPPVIPLELVQRAPFPLPVPTSAQLVTAPDSNTNDNPVNYSRDDLITSIDINDHINDSRDIFGTIEEFVNEEQRIDDAIDKEKNVLNEFQSGNNINWDDMFDAELFQDVDMPTKPVEETLNKPNKPDMNDKVFEICFPTDKPDKPPKNNILQENTGKRSKKNETENKQPKRKNQTKVTDTIAKKVKKMKAEVKSKCEALSKTCNRNDKVTDSVKNWLNGVDPNNPVEEFEAPLDLPEIKRNKEKPQNLIKNVSNEKPKKTVQAQLANKGGIMKFRKPNKNITENVIDDTSTKVTDNNEEQQSLKEKKPKSKFVAPIKSQIPIKDVTYEINEVNETNAWKYKLDSIRDKEIVAVLLFSNGFCQLNNQHTDDVCVPEGVLLHFDDHYCYLKGDTNRNLVSQILNKNATICYDGKALLIYLMSKLQLDFDITYILKIIDIKIGGSLLEPDCPPETFAALQRLTGSEPQYTIATTCTKQKAAWYATLLATTATAVRNKLEQEDLWQVFVDIEMGILPIIADMEQRGVCVDMDKLKEMEKILVAKMKEVESECSAAAGRSFQINSTVQVRALLYDELKLDEKAGLKVRETLTTGAKSTSETMLKSLVSLHPLPRLILEYRHLHKAYATFLQGVAQYVRGGVVRPVWVQTAAATGRIASSNPNLQAIPKVPFSLRLFPDDSDDNHTKESLRFRSVYISRPNHVILAADWRHVECRVFARAAADTSLQQALEAPDLFRRLAADWLQKPEDEISSADRERTKRIVYASLYGAGPRKLMDILDVDYSQALSIAASFDRTFPSLRSFGRRVAAKCLTSGGRVATLCGRARNLSHIASSDAAQRSHAERQALNFIVQGSAADVCKLAMSRAVQALQKQGLRARLLLQIHDELVWEVEHQDLAKAAEVIRSAMEQCGSPAGLPSLPVALSVGRNWGELEPYLTQTLQSDSQPFDI
ncbi:hypothetical protein O0L34_g4719 [Tuta absoluta]|nr:hypothetical protein O0L34_g4719 [Tuta absoluta]